MAEFQNNFLEAKFSWELVRGLNKYIDTTQPWTLFKEEKMSRLGTVMYVLLENMRKIAVHLWPVMPEASENMLEQLGISFHPEKVNLQGEIDVWGLLEHGSEVASKSNLFPRVELPKEEPAPKKKKEPKPSKKKTKEVQTELPGIIEFPDFQKVDMRVGTVLSADKHPDADKLLLVKIDTGDEEPRQVVAGLAEFFKPEELEGRQVVVVTNLKPRKLRGEVSQGMILAVRNGDEMQLLTVTAPVGNGCKIS